jgi:hypothetical protein
MMWMTPLGIKIKVPGTRSYDFSSPFHATADVVLAAALDEILPQIGLDMVVGPGAMAGRDADEAHHQRFAAAGIDIDPELMGQLFFVVNVFLNVIPIHDDGTMFFRHV